MKNNIKQRENSQRQENNQNPMNQIEENILKTNKRKEKWFK